MLNYSQYGATGDGKTCDFDAIIATHAEANKLGLPVCANDNATYYIGGGAKTAIIQTDTNWGTAKFIVDDTNVQDRTCPVFRVVSAHSPTEIDGVSSIKKGQAKLDIAMPQDALLEATDDTKRQFIRYGLNPDNGVPQTDIFIARKNGELDPQTAPIWDFENITSLVAYPMDDTTLTIQGGYFTTIANAEIAEYKYFARNIEITRSNVVADGITHVITGEGERGAPYHGFITISTCANVTVQNCKLSGHKTYTTIGDAGAEVRMGSYDILVAKAANIVFKNCVQLNDIHDTTIWGIFGSNFTKNMVFDTVKLSRFDAHKGTTNTVIKDSEIGHMGVKLIGSGSCLIENTKVTGREFIDLRQDYGCTWEGNITIRNCQFVAPKGYTDSLIVLGARYTGLHDFGYQCYMPRKIVIDGMSVEDNDGQNGVSILPVLSENYLNEGVPYPCVLPEVVEVRGVETASGKPWVLSDNMGLYKFLQIY